MERMRRMVGGGWDWCYWNVIKCVCVMMVGGGRC